MIKTFSNFKFLLFIAACLLVIIKVGEVDKYFHTGTENCKEDPACDENCPVCCQLPFHIHTGQVLISLDLTPSFTKFLILQASSWLIITWHRPDSGMRIKDLRP